MSPPSPEDNARDALYLARACELAARAKDNVSPNPPVGAVLVRDGAIIGEGFHHRRGEAHAEVEALRDAESRGNRDLVAGATAYVSLEPCNHHGRTPPCSQALIAARVTRAVIAAPDPNPRTAGGGMAALREAGIRVDLAETAAAQELIRRFTVAIRERRPYVTLKLAASIDGYVAPAPGPFWLTGEETRRAVRELRLAHDAVLVGAGTLRVDDPLLTARPPAASRRMHHRVIACGVEPPSPDRRIFAVGEDPHVPPLLLVPQRAISAFAPLVGLAELLPVESDDSGIDLTAALAALFDHEIASVLCEGGPRLASALLAADLVDRIEWFTAPLLLAGPDAVPALASAPGARMDRFGRIGADASGEDLRSVYDRRA